MSGTDPHAVNPIKRPCAADRFAAQAPGHGYLKVPFARCADGIARHVTAIAGLTIGPFHCLDCEERLSLRRPQNKRAHFAHRPDSLCTGETALHRYAKELLGLRKLLTLPALVLQEEGLAETVFKAGIYAFDKVVPEHNLDTFQPDAMVTHKGAELAVEFLVSHAVDAAKRAKVLERDLSMVEIDLSGVRAGQLSGDELDEAILHSAPRQWIHHRRKATAVKKLADQVAAKRADRGGCLKWHIEKRVRTAYPEDWEDEGTAVVTEAGLSHLIDIDTDCAHWFAVPRAIWQAQALADHVIGPSQLYSPGGRSIAVKGEWPNERSFVSKIPDWMIRTDLSDYPVKRLAEAGFDRTTFGSPHQAVWSYFAALHMRGEAVFWSREEQSFFIDPDLHGRLHRRVELHRKVARSLEAVRQPDPDISYSRWTASYIVDGITVAQLIEKGGDVYDALLQRLSLIEAMLPSYSRKVVDDFCGLPLEPIRARNLAAAAADEEERARKALEAANLRQKAIRGQAEQKLGSDAAEWLGRLVKSEGKTIAAYASTSDDAFYTVERWLAAAFEEHRQAKLTSERTAALQAELTVAARKAFSQPAMADLFLRSGQPSLGGGRPIDRCDSHEALRMLIALLPKRR